MPYSKEFFAEPLTALCLVVAIERLVAVAPLRRGWPWAQRCSFVRRACCLRLCCLLVAWFQDGFRASLRTAAGCRVPGVVVTLAYNSARFGHPLRFGYEDVGFTTPLLTGMAGLLFEPTKSLLLFAPIAVLLPFALWRLWRTIGGRSS